MRRLVRRHAARLRAMVTVAVSAMALVGASAASAAPTWLAPVDLSTASTSIDGPRVAVDGQGDAIAVWSRNNGHNFTLQAAARPVDSGAWQAPVDVSALGQDTGDPQVAVDARGDAVAVWAGFNGFSGVMQAAVGTAHSGVWQAPVDVSVPEYVRDPQVALDPQGNAVAVWAGLTDLGWVVQSAVRPARSGAWQAPQDLSAPGQNFEPPQVAVDARGDAVAVWDNLDGAGWVVRAAVRPAHSGAWQAPVALSAASHGAFDPRVAVDPRGDAVAVWADLVRVWGDHGAQYVVQGAVRPAGSGAWQAPVALSAPDQDAVGPQVAVNPQGDAVAVWEEVNGDLGYIVQGAIRPADTGAWHAPVDLSGMSPFVAGLQVAVGSQGDAFAVWDDNHGTQWVVQSAVRPAGSGAWQAPLDVSGAGEDAQYPQVAVDAQGDAVAVWQTWQANGPVYATVRGAGYDAAGPLLRGLAIPSAGTVGQPLSFAVTPLDVWSPPETSSWSFGDGTGAIGTSVTHAYAAAGSYQVTLTSADALGNSSTTVATIAIAPAMTPAPSPSLPLLTDVRQSHRRWREASRLPARVRRPKVPLGTTFSFALNEQARVTLAFTQHVSGRRVGRRCVSPSNRNRRSPVCQRTVARATLSVTAHAGVNKLTFQGRISRNQALRPGRYTVVLTATDAAGQRSSPETLSFTIVT